ncbi:MAG: PmoA family protein [Sedimentisphaerales bacterium]|nr:PmoA family protein [Sedimentisphaerales bacterium]
MNRWITVVFLLIVTCSCSLVSAAQQKVTAKIEKDQVAVTIDGTLFTCYKFSTSQKYPYFWPVNGPVSGQSITTETSEPYPHHHSLFFGCDRVNGGNYWQDVNERGQILSQGPTITNTNDSSVTLSDRCLWKQPGKEPIIEDKRWIVISAPSEQIRIIDFKIMMIPLVDIEILKTNHSLFSARVVPELSVKSGGTLINAEGNKTEKGTWGIASAWCDYSGTRDGVTEGIALLQHPRNRWFPSPWFTRDYGFFSPTPMYWLEGDKLYLAMSEPLALEYRVVVHADDVKEADIAGLFEQYKKKAK